ncbi:MAG: aldolase/citrate lyase family protein, partial [Burkholderiales bacterium]
MVVVCQLETKEAVENAEQIAAVPGIDVLFIGPNDLSANLNQFRQFENPEFKKAMGPNAIKALMAVAQSVGTQNQQTQQAAGEARQSFFGADPFTGADVGVPKIGAVAPGGTAPASQRPPGLAGPAPAAALAQAVQSQTIDPMGEAPMLTAPPAPSEAPARRPVTPFSRLQEGLGEGQTVSGEVGGMRFSVTGKVAGQDAGRAIVAEGVKQGLPYDQIVTNVFAAGGKLPENLSAYGEKQFMQAYRSALREAGGDSKSVTTQQKIAATRAAIEAGGKVPDAFKSQVGITREDEHALAGEVVAEAMKNGMSFGRAREYAESRGLRLSKEDEVAFGQRAYG